MTATLSRGANPSSAVVLALTAAGPPAAPERAVSPAASANVGGVVASRLVSDLGSITSITGVGDSRLFLTLRDGRIVIWNGARVLPSEYVDLSSAVSCCGSRGLLSAAFHPKYASNGLFFVGYTDRAGNLVVARYKRSAKDPNRADPRSAAVLLRIPYPAGADHHGGALEFGPDGYLYVGVGDGGSPWEVACSAQSDDVRLGKILRLDINRKAKGRPYYAIPRSNPFAGAGAPRDEIWAKGLRDPWRFSFDRRTGDLYIADVGQRAREEIDFQSSWGYGGENYGWGIMEGSVCASGSSSTCPAGLPPCNSPKLQTPILEYDHESGDCGIVGGYVYRGSRSSWLSGVYMYGDYCSGRIWGKGRALGVIGPGLTTFGEDSAGELYAGTEDGSLYRLIALPGGSARLNMPARESVVPPPTPVPVAAPQAPSEPVAAHEPPADPPELRLFTAIFPTPTAAAPPPDPAPEPIVIPEEPPEAPPEPEPPPPEPPPTAAPPAPEPSRQPPAVAPRDQPPPRPVEPRRG